MVVRTEGGVVVGNVYNKYESSNPIVRRLMHGFHSAFDDLARVTTGRTVFEVGCGEGYLTERLLDRARSVRGCDISEEVLDEARRRCGGRAELFHASLEDLDPAEHGADVVVCCEVLEHLPDPADGLRRLAALASDWLILSVPREPIWRALNLARGRYVTSLGNTPGHLQHFSRRQFIRFVQHEADVVDVRTPLPWTMLSARARS